MRNILGLLFCLIVLPLVGCASGKIVTPFEVAEQRGFDFGDNSHFVVLRSETPDYIIRLPLEEQLVVLLTDLTRQRLIEKGVKSEVIQQFAGYEDMRRTGKIGLFEVVLVGGGTHPALNYSFIYRPARVLDSVWESSNNAETKLSPGVVRFRA
jgi:hypothetical protein